MKTDLNWNKLAANILKSELKLHDINYEQLRQKLLAIGVDESLTALQAKVNRGTFQFSFFLQCAAAIGLKNLRLDSLTVNE